MEIFAAARDGKKTYEVEDGVSMLVRIQAERTSVPAEGSWLPRGLQDFFGAPDTKNSNYIDLTASHSFASGWGLSGHVGQQKVKNISAADYTDYKIGVTKDFGGWVFGLAYVDTDAEEAAYTFTSGAGKSVNVGDSTLVFSVSKTF